MDQLRPRVACLAVILALLTAAAPAQAAVSAFWQELDGSASGTGVSQAADPAAVFDTAVAVDENGHPVVVYTEYPTPDAILGAITVKRWTGAAWQTLSGPSGIGEGYEPRVQVAADGTIYVAWLTDDDDGNAEIRLRAWNGSAFVELDGSDSPGGLSGANPGITPPFSLAVGDDGNPIVAFLAVAETGVVLVSPTPAIVDGTTQVYVRRWTGATWEFVGSGFEGGGASDAVSFTSSSKAVLHDVDTPSLTVDSTGAPVVAFTYFTTIAGIPVANTDIYVTRWNGAEWTAVGRPVPAADGTAGRGGAGGVSNSASGSFIPSLAADATGRLVLAWEEDAAGGATYVWVRRWTGTTWAALGTSASGSGITQTGTSNSLPRVAVDVLGRPVVTWSALTVPEDPAQIFVRRWNGSTAWEDVGFHSSRDGGISEAALDAHQPALDLTATSGPIVAWLDALESGTNQIFLRQYFTGSTFALTTRVSGKGTVSSDPGGVACSAGACEASFPSGTSVTLLPQGSLGWSFAGWVGDCTGTGSCTLDMTAARSVNASFVAVHALNVAVATPSGTSGQGAVGSLTGPAGTCLFGGGGDCGSDVVRGTPVSLQAVVEPGNKFLRWSGGPCSGRSNASCAFTMSANVSTTALFRAVTDVSVAKAGNGAGTVTGSGISCGADCAQQVYTGTVVRLTPTPATGSVFLGWTGDVCDGQATGACLVPTAGELNRSVTATFALTQRLLTVTVVGEGAVSGPGVACDDATTPCALVFDYGTTLPLTAVAAPGHRFTGWSQGCTGVAGCTARMTANRSVTATFKPEFGLTVTQTGDSPAPGAIKSSPAGINCGVDCNHTYLVGTSVTLTRATPTAGTTFSWGGDCAFRGSSPTCTLTLGANASVTADYSVP